MNREQYLAELERYLAKLPQDERKNAMDYYREYTAELMENGQDIEAKLGSPRDLANSIIGEQALYEMDNPDAGIKGRMNGFGMAILMLFALPIGLPLALAVAAVAFALLIVIVVFVFVLALTVAIVGVAGIVCVLVSFVLWITVPATGLFFSGAGVLMAGVGILGGFLVMKLWGVSFKLIRNIFSSVLRRSRKTEVQ